MVELKARFDERANIRWAKKLEQAGVHVVYGLPALKSHAKCILVVRREGDGRPPLRPHRHRQLQPEDGPPLHRPRPVHGRPRDRRRHRRDVQLPDRLLAAAATTARSWSRRSTSTRGSCARSSGRSSRTRPDRPARIRMKMNSLLDAPSIRALYRASQAGVEVELNVRGICALRPGVPGISENIEVVSVVGRFLEHSRIYSFERPGEPERVFIGLGRPDAAQPLQPRRAGHPDRGRRHPRADAGRARPLASPTTPTPGSSAPDGAWTPPPARTASRATSSAS